MSSERVVEVFRLAANNVANGSRPLVTSAPHHRRTEAGRAPGGVAAHSQPVPAKHRATLLRPRRSSCSCSWNWPHAGGVVQQRTDALSKLLKEEPELLCARRQLKLTSRIFESQSPLTGKWTAKVASAQGDDDAEEREVTLGEEGLEVLCTLPGSRAIPRLVAGATRCSVASPRLPLVALSGCQTPHIRSSLVIGHQRRAARATTCP